MHQEEAARLVDELFESWAPSLLRYALRMTRSFATADDLVQEAFLALYRHLREGERIENPKSWTFAVVRNQARKHARSLRRLAEDLEPCDVLDTIPAMPRWPDVEAGIEAKPRIDLSVLSDRETEAVLLRLQSFKYREIAITLGVGPKTVCTLLARALKKLRIAAQPDWPIPVKGSSPNREAHDALR